MTEHREIIRGRPLPSHAAHPARPRQLPFAPTRPVRPARACRPSPPARRPSGPLEPAAPRPPRAARPARSSLPPFAPEPGPGGQHRLDFTDVVDLAFRYQFMTRWVSLMTAKLTRRARPGIRLFVPVTVLAALTLLATACSSSSPAPTSTVFHGATVPTGSWPYPDGDLANTRVAPDSVISAANVSGLREAWAFKLTGPAAAGLSYTGSMTAPPV